MISPCIYIYVCVCIYIYIYIFIYIYIYMHGMVLWYHMLTLSHQLNLGVCQNLLDNIWQQITSNLVRNKVFASLQR